MYYDRMADKRKEREKALHDMMDKINNIERKNFELFGESIIFDYSVSVYGKAIINANNR